MNPDECYKNPSCHAAWQRQELAENGSSFSDETRPIHAGDSRRSGGYAALMGAVREPALYRCAATCSSDTATSSAGDDYLDRALGTDAADLKKRSALYNIDRIQVRIYIAVGKEDQHASRLRDALGFSRRLTAWNSICACARSWKSTRLGSRPSKAQ